ncbi:MAG: GatB/YqeY domain-containing protein, partial [Candidatus Eremiobacteraeota bacterium]|nr:GatB/YqeY domain-containing protein [Candidatus Eremiobacteraeota bacterium]
IVQSVLAELPSDARNQGAVMKVVMPQLKGLADGNLVRKVVEQELGGR